MSHNYDSMGDMVADLEWAGEDRSNEHGGAIALGSEGTVIAYVSETLVDKETGCDGFRNKLGKRFDVTAVNESLAWFRS